jgi:hypothetical protein
LILLDNASETAKVVLDFGAKPSLLSWYPFWRYAP